MNKKAILLFLLSLIFFATNAQTKDKKVDIRLGAGMTYIDKNSSIPTFEVETNRKLTPYFAVGASIAFGRDAADKFNMTSFEKVQLNLFVSPFKNNRRNDFRIGAGIGYFDIAGYQAIGMLFDPKETKHYSYKNSSFGFNFSAENSYMLTDRFFIGIKAFVEPYLKETVNTNYGAMLRLGVKF